MKFVLEIDCDNETFGEDETSRNVEVSYILENIGKRVEDGSVFGNVRDTNGNTVGRYRFVATEQK